MSLIVKYRDISVITSVSYSDGSLIFKRATLSFGGETKLTIHDCEGIVLSIDSSCEPTYTPHPDGGWVSPSYRKISAIVESCGELDFIDHIRCKCQKGQISEQDRISLSNCGHTASCKRAQPPPSLGYQKDSEVKISASQPEVKTAPRDGLDNYDLENLTAALGGTQDTISEGLKQIGILDSSINNDLITRQLAKTFNFSTCSKCGVWSYFNDPAQRLCVECS